MTSSQPYKARCPTWEMYDSALSGNVRVVSFKKGHFNLIEMVLNFSARKDSVF